MRPGGYLGTAERWSLMDDLCFFFVSYREDKQDKLTAYPAYPSCLKVDLRLAAVCDMANGSRSNMLLMAIKLKPHGIYRI